MKNELAISHGHPVRTQLAALCWRVKNGQVKVLLITSRETGRWVLPKGWPMLKHTDPEAAAIEAWEEAGVTGTSGAIIGHYDYNKVIGRGSRRQTYLMCRVEVHAIHVSSLAKNYPERKQRRRKWFTPERGAEVVDEPQLAALLTAFAEPAACVANQSA